MSAELVTHDCPCSECLHFRDMGLFNVPICRFHLMAVSRVMRVTYKVDRPAEDGGLCFVAKQDDEPAQGGQP